MKVLVAFSSKHGSTTEIAEMIGEVIKSEGLDVEVRNVEDVDDIYGYDAVVLGSAVYMGNWLQPALRFIEEHSGQLAARPNWLFSSGPLGDPLKPDKESAVRAEHILAKTKARDHRIFAGRLDKRRLNFAERAMVVAVRAPEGDFRDWEEIRGWSKAIAASLKVLEVPVMKT